MACFILVLCSFVAAVAGRVHSEAPASSDAGGVRALVDAIKKEEVHVSVDLHSKLKVLINISAFMYLLCACYLFLASVRMCV